jgi:hypothetical protein
MLLCNVKLVLPRTVMTNSLCRTTTDCPVECMLGMLPLALTDPTMLFEATE